LLCLASLTCGSALHTTCLSPPRISDITQSRVVSDHIQCMVTKCICQLRQYLWSQHGGTRPWTRHGARRASKVFSSLHADVLGHLVRAAWQSKFLDVDTIPCSKINNMPRTSYSCFFHMACISSNRDTVYQYRLNNECMPEHANPSRS
jgi:hypothetical protein